MGSVASASAASSSDKIVGYSTLDKTIKEGPGGAFKALTVAKGEPYTVRQTLTQASSKRTKKRKSLAFFAQFTDPQVADEMSPGRVEFLDPASGATSAAWRPQEAFGTRVLDQIVRNVNANNVSAVKQANGKRAKLGFAISTGDQADSQQLNEARWYIDALNGERIDPFSGKPITDPATQCPGASQAEIDKINADVAARHYTGVQDFDDWPGRLPARYQGFWDPDVKQDAGPYAAFPQYRGILDAAQQPHNTAGLKVPWYMSRGNHDGLVQGNFPSNNPIFSPLISGCSKVVPIDGLDPAGLSGVSNVELLSRLTQPTTLSEIFGGAIKVAPDPDRAYQSKTQYKTLFGKGSAHGFGYVNKNQLKASDNSASYYAFTPRKGVRFISIDTVAEGGGYQGNLDDPQYKWLSRELDDHSGRAYNSKGKLVKDGDSGQLIVIFAHHTIETMTNTTPDEGAGKCTPADFNSGCDQDPRTSTPLHYGSSGKQSLKDLLLKYPNVIAFVNGHTHHNAVDLYKRKSGGTGFWEVNTASHVDWAQQARLIELFDNEDGTLSIFGTLVDQAASVKPPASGTSKFTDSQMASISRTLAANDPQTLEVTGGGGLGKRKDRNVELLLKDPRDL